MGVAKTLNEPSVSNDKSTTNLDNLQNDMATFSIEKIIDNSKTDFDLYLNLNKHTVLYGTIGYYWVKSELEELLKSGYTHFLVKQEDKEKAHMYSKINSLPVLDKKLAPNDRILQIESIGENFTKFLWEGNITDSCVNEGKKISTSLTQCILEDKRCVSALNSLAGHDQYIYLHSIRVATYAVAIAIGMGLKDESKLAEIASGGIFHDIGKKDVPLEVLNKTGALNEDEWQAMRSHPLKGFEAVESCQLSPIAKAIIRHHHEKPDGSGYPDGLLHANIPPEVEIATLADIFDALTSSRSYQQKRTKFQALDFIKNQMVSKKIISPDIYAALVNCLSET